MIFTDLLARITFDSKFQRPSQLAIKYFTSGPHEQVLITAIVDLDGKQHKMLNVFHQGNPGRHNSYIIIANRQSNCSFQLPSIRK